MLGDYREYALEASCVIPFVNRSFTVIAERFQADRRGDIFSFRALCAVASIRPLRSLRTIRSKAYYFFQGGQQFLTPKTSGGSI